MAKIDNLYSSLLLAIIEKGYWYDDLSRLVRCKQISSVSFEHQISPIGEFPVITTKDVYLKGIVGELIWFLRGLDNLEYLHENNIHFWDDDTKNFDEMYGMYVGRNYGVQWRDWTDYKGKVKNSNKNYGPTTYDRGSLDQIGHLIANLTTKPMSRRHIVTAWNPAELNQTALPPCHWAFEILPRPLYPFEKDEYFKDKTHGFTLKWHQRSVDTFLGLPFNITSYAILGKIIEELTGYVFLSLIGDLSNVHLYEPHIELAREQLKNNPTKYKAPEFKFSDKALTLFSEYKAGVSTLDGVFNNLEIEDFIFEDYQRFPAIKAKMIAPEPKK